jgi:hypothetical protein
MLFRRDGGLLEPLTRLKMLFVVTAVDQPCRRRWRRLPSRGLTMVSLVICHRFDLLSDRTHTTGVTRFPECLKHLGKSPKHSGKPSPSATLGEELPGKWFTGKN